MVLDVVVGDVGELAALRRALGEFAGAAGPRSGDIVLAANELATNSIVHAGGPCRVVATYPHDGVIRIEVADDGGRSFGFPDGVVPSSSPGGRGLLIVGALASRCGVTSTPRSTNVWFEIDLPD